MKSKEIMLDILKENKMDISNYTSNSLLKKYPNLRYPQAVRNWLQNLIHWWFIKELNKWIYELISESWRKITNTNYINSLLQEIDRLKSIEKKFNRIKNILIK